MNWAVVYTCTLLSFFFPYCSKEVTEFIRYVLGAAYGVTLVFNLEDR